MKFTVHIQYLLWPICDVFSGGVPHVGHHVRHYVAKGVKGAEHQEAQKRPQGGEDPAQRETSNSFVVEHVFLTQVTSQLQGDWTVPPIDTQRRHSFFVWRPPAHSRQCLQTQLYTVSCLAGSTPSGSGRARSSDHEYTERLSSDSVILGL